MSPSPQCHHLHHHWHTYSRHTHTHTYTHQHQQHQQRKGWDRADWSQLVPANTFHCTLMTAGPPASVTLALTPLHGPLGIPQGQEGWGGRRMGEEEGGGVTQMREDTPGGGTALRELEVMNILTDRRGSNEFKLNYMCWAPHEQERERQGYFKGADIITPFRKFDKKEICVRQSEMQNTAAKLVLYSLKVRYCQKKKFYGVLIMCFFFLSSLLLESLLSFFYHLCGQVTHHNHYSIKRFLKFSWYVFFCSFSQSS